MTRQAIQSEYSTRVVIAIKALLGLAILLPGLALAQEPAENTLELPPDIPPENATEQPRAPDNAAEKPRPIENTDEQPLPPKVQDEQLEPSVTIRDEEGKRIEEYSRGGQVYMVKVIPDKGVPYYYIDSDGDGQLETAPTKDLEQVRPVYWKVKEWD